MSFLGFHRHGESGKDDGRRPEPHPGWEAALSGETEAFLEGRIVEHLVAAGRMVPTWAIVNKLAHASPGELADLAETDARPSDTAEPGEPVWRSAQRSLASRLLATGAADDEITRIQQTSSCHWSCGSSSGPLPRRSPSDKPSTLRAMRSTPAIAKADDIQAPSNAPHVLRAPIGASPRDPGRRTLAA